MNELLPCVKCGHTISDTALVCPYCGNQPSSEHARKGLAGVKVLGVTAACVALGPMGVVGGLGSHLADNSERVMIKRTAKKVGGIDAFSIGDEAAVVVSKDAFHILAGAAMMGGAPNVPGIPWGKIKECCIDESRSRKGAFMRSERVAVFLSYASADKTGTDMIQSGVYTFTGKDARQRAAAAVAKIMEYAEAEGGAT